MQVSSHGRAHQGFRKSLKPSSVWQGLVPFREDGPLQKLCRGSSVEMEARDVGESRTMGYPPRKAAGSE